MTAFQTDAFQQDAFDAEPVVGGEGPDVGTAPRSLPVVIATSALPTVTATTTIPTVAEAV